jgi:hypothetical protein
LKQL